MIDTLLLKPSLHFTPLHLTLHFFPLKLHPTTLHYTSPPSHLFYPRLNFLTLHFGARGGVVVKALRYKPAGRVFDSRWCHWNFQ